MEAIVDEIIDNYIEFLLYLISQRIHPVVWGPVPSYKDNSPIDEKFPFLGSELERVKATQYFNKSMKKCCDKEHIDFVSIFDELIDSQGLIKSEYQADVCHLNTKAWKFVIPSLDSLLEKYHKS